jgi:UDP-N-acetylglucosamine transferase subunit ALG13
VGATPETFPVGRIWGNVNLILTLVGTNPYSFERLVRGVDDYAPKCEEEIFIQLGHTSYIPKNARYQRFLEKREILAKIKEASLVITQGGFGSIADCLREGKRIVAVPRNPELQESHDIQEEIVRELERQGRLVGVYEIEELPAAISKAKIAVFKQGTPHQVTGIINRFINGY